MISHNFRSFFYIQISFEISISSDTCNNSSVLKFLYPHTISYSSHCSLPLNCLYHEITFFFNMFIYLMLNFWSNTVLNGSQSSQNSSKLGKVLKSVTTRVFPHHNIHKYIWTSPNGKIQSQIDHIVIVHDI